MTFVPNIVRVDDGVEVEMTLVETSELEKLRAENVRLRAYIIGAKQSILKHTSDTVWFYGANKNMTLLDFLEQALAGGEEKQ